MKVLLVHNYYGSASPSGENVAVDAEAELLRLHGHQVFRFAVSSDRVRSLGPLGALLAAAVVPWNPYSLYCLRRAIRRHRPAIVHFHNTFPLLSPSVFYANSRLDCATIFTVHNYRVACAAGIPVRAEHPCTVCFDRASSLPAVRHGCYRNSRLATAPIAGMIALHRKLRTWGRLDGVITLSNFQRAQLINTGFDPSTVYVKPHFYLNPPDEQPWDVRAGQAIFVGRLGPEKGIAFLLDAWRSWGTNAPELQIVGDGPDRSALERAVDRSSAAGRVTFLGQRPFPEVQSRLASCRIAIVPSVSFEAFPMVIREAFALGVPVAASRIGALAELVIQGVNGFLFEPRCAASLLRVVRGAWESPRQLRQAALGARATFEERFTADANYAILMRIYAAAIERHNAISGERM